MCSKLYADGELAATPYETDKVLRHRELCMGLNVLYAKKNHDYGDSFHQTYIEEGMAMHAFAWVISSAVLRRSPAFSPRTAISRL